jgi:hypothetical protein
MANPDYEFTEGWDKYGAGNVTNVNADSSLGNRIVSQGEWNSMFSVAGGAYAYIGPALSGTGYAVGLSFSGSSGSTRCGGIAKTLPGNYARHVGGCCMKYITSQAWTGYFFLDGATIQLCFFFNTSGQIVVYRGNGNGTLLATSTQTAVINSINYVEWDITFHASTGIIKIWLNGALTSINLTGQNTVSSANNYSNGCGPFLYAANGGSGDVQGWFDHTYGWLYTASGGTETPALTNPLVQTDFPSADSAVAMTPVAATIGAPWTSTATTNAPGANQLVLRPFVAEVAATINSVAFVPQATSVGAKMKPVIYSNSGSAPNALLSTGAEVVGTTIGTAIVMPLTTPQALTAGTTYWIGYITDTSVVINLADNGTAGYKAANTYTSGAPGTAPAMTANQASYELWGNLTGMAVNYSQVNDNPAAGLLSYNQSNTVSAEDLYTFPNLSVSPSAIYTVGIKTFWSRSDTGARTGNCRMKSVSTESSGNTPGISPATSFGWGASYFRTDPNTSVTWANAAAVNAAKGGPQVAS